MFSQEGASRLSEAWHQKQLAFNQLVVGSNPIRPTIFTRNPPQGGFLRFEPKKTVREERAESHYTGFIRIGNLHNFQARPCQT